MKFKNLILICLLCFISLYSFKLPAVSSDKGPYLVLHVHECSGFFAVFSSVISVLNFYETGNFSGLKIDLDGGLYLDTEKGPNWWEYFFEPIELGDSESTKYIFNGPEILHFVGSGFTIDRKRGYDLIQKYIHVKPNIQAEVDEFVSKKFKDHFVIGIHHRGTDKILEAPLVPFARTLETLNKLIVSLPNSSSKKLKVYVATDQQAFLDYLRSIYPSLIISSNFARSKDNKSLHGTPGFYKNNYQKGKEALIDCLLLSRCNMLIYTPSSSLSLAVLKFNPDLPAISAYGN